MRRIALALALILVVACGDDGAVVTTTGATTTTVLPTTTAGAVTTTTTAATSTSLAPTTTTAPFYSVATHGLFPDPLIAPAEGHGSGCAPPGDELPDGIWFGFARQLADDELTFDLACFFTGAEAEAAAASDGTEAVDFYIRNQNPKLFGLELDHEGTAYSVDASADDVFPVAGPMTAWPPGNGFVPCPGEFCAVWLFVNGGEVTELVEQYLP